MQIMGNIHLIGEINMIIVFFISGLVLNTQEMKKAKSQSWGVVYGFASTLLLTPLLAFAMKEIPLQPKEFAMGGSIGWVVGCLVGWLVACSCLVGWPLSQRPSFVMHVLYAYPVMYAYL